MRSSLRRASTGAVSLAAVALFLNPASAGSPSPAPATGKPADPRYAGLERAYDGPCRGMWRVQRTSTCTHGPDTPEHVSGDYAAGTDAPTVTTLPPELLCGDDGRSGRRTQVVYVRASDVTDRYSTQLGAMRNIAKWSSEVYRRSALETGGGRHIRYVTDVNQSTYGCDVNVANAVVSPTGDDSPGNTETELRAQGYNRPDRKYMLFIEAGGCYGLGSMWGSDLAGSGNIHNWETGFQWNYKCGDTWDSGVAVHEHMHNMGGVQQSAPHSTPGWHCYDESDRMCYDDDGAGGVTMQQICSTTKENIFDCNHDDYFHTNPPAGSYLATHWNSADNAWLIGGAAYADVTGDGLADAVVANSDRTLVRGSSGSGFGGESWFTTIPSYGSRGERYADVTGDGRADQVRIEENATLVRTSNGTSFNAPASWTGTTGFYGTKGTYYADVTGDGRADGIVMNDAQVVVRRSTGTALSGNENWSSTAFYGNKATAVADVTGDGRADLIAFNHDRVTVRRSTGSAFSTTNELFTTNPYYGTLGTYVADVTGDGRGDAIVVNGDKITVRRSTGTVFSGNESWTTTPFNGTRGTFFVDVTGDRLADAVAVNENQIVVRRSTGSSFAAEEIWHYGRFY